MSSITVKIKLLANAVDDYRFNLKSSVLPLYCCTDTGSEIVLGPNERRAVPTGVALDLPDLYEAVVVPNSALAEDQGTTVLNNPGTIDPDFKGEIQVILINLGDRDTTITRGDQVAELRIQKFVRAEFKKVDSLSSSSRGGKGLGSTGV